MNEPQRVKVTVSNRTVVRVLLIILATFLVLKLIIKIDLILELIFIAFFLSLALNPAVSFISRSLRIKSRVLATGIAYLLVVIILAGFFSLVLPPLFSQTETFIKNLPATLDNLANSSSPAGNLVRHYHLNAQTHDISQYLEKHISSYSKPVLSTATKVGEGIIAFITVLVLTFMFLVEGPVWASRYWKIEIMNHKTKEHKEIVKRMYKIITGYVNGQVILALIGGGVTLVALLITSSILNVSVNTVALAGIIVFTGLIPMIGHFIGGGIVVLACLLVSWPLAVIMAVFLLVYMQLESVTLQPYIQSKYNELTPLLVFIAALIGIGAGGILGAFVAIPAAGCLKVLATEYVKTHKLVTQS
jgi:predicted PurR-regulated permease PerM